MNICYISSYPPPPTGVAAYTARLCLALAALKVEITVFTDTYDCYTGGISVIKAWSRNSFTYSLRLFNIIAQNSFDVVHIQHEYWLYGRGIYSVEFLFLLALLKLLAKPIVVTMHCVVPRGELSKAFFYKHGLGSKLILIKRMYVVLYTKLIGSISSKVIVHSNIAKGILAGNYGFDWAKVSVIHHGIESFKANRQLSQESAKHKLGIFDEDMLLFFGQIRLGKGIERAIKAMEKVVQRRPSCCLVVAGKYDSILSPESAGYLDELVSLTKDLNLSDNVIFRTDISEADIPTYYDAADIFLLPYTESEIVAASGPLSIAVSKGKLIIATKIKRFLDTLRDGENSLLVPPSDSNCLADAILLLLENPELGKRLSQKLRKIVSARSWNRIASRTLATYQAVVR